MSGFKEGKTLILLNPHSGRGRAKRRFESMGFPRSSQIEVIETSSGAHARERARSASASGYQTVFAAGGDGTVHEVACGILDADRQATLGVIPLGSANDFAWSLAQQLPPSTGAGGSDLDGVSIRTEVDVGRVTLNNDRVEHFVESLGTGLSGCVTVESRKISGLQGIPLYALATIRALRNTRAAHLRLSIDGKVIEQPTLLLSVLSGKREGNFKLAPTADMSDGQLDVVHGKCISRLEALRLLPLVALFGVPRNHAQIDSHRGRSIDIETDWDLVVHADGEILARSGEGIRHLQIRVQPKRLSVVLWRGSMMSSFWSWK